MNKNHLENNMSDSDRDNESQDKLLSNGKKPNNLNYEKSNQKAMFMEYQTLKDECIRLRRYMYGLTAVAVSGILIMIIIIAILFGKLSHDVKHHTHQPKVGEEVARILEKEDLCIPCDNIRLGPSDEEDRMLNEFTRKHEPGGEQCCVETPKELLALLELVSTIILKFN